MLFAGSDDEVVRGFLLQNQPHALDIILGVAPVPERIHVAQFQMILEAFGNAAGGQGDFPSDEVLAPALGLVVKENAVDGEHAVGLPILLDHPEAVLLGNGIGAVGMEGGGLPLGHLLHLAEKLRGGSLVEPGLLGQPQNPAGLQNAKHTQGIHIAGIFGHVKADLDMALGGQIVDFVGLNQGKNADQAGRIGEVAVVKGDLALQVVDPGGVGNGRPADDAVDLIALFQQKFGKIAAVLTGDAGDECFFHR